jgi:hypothetical protein
VVEESFLPFPKRGLLADNLNRPLSRFPKSVTGCVNAAFSYIVRSVKLDRENEVFEQHGSAPNFQGDRLTLCTCKHQMRASLTTTQWESDVWIAGFTSRCLFERRHWLFYLTKVDAAYESHSDLWDNLPAKARKAKNASQHFLGDLFEPGSNDLAGDDRFVPQNYRTPPHHTHHKHRHDDGWHNDINYRHAGKFGHPPLLVGDPELTFLWGKPTIYLDHAHCRNYSRWASVKELFTHLWEGEP